MCVCIGPTNRWSSANMLQLPCGCVQGQYVCLLGAEWGQDHQWPLPVLLQRKKVWLYICMYVSVLLPFLFIYILWYSFPPPSYSVHPQVVLLLYFLHPFSTLSFFPSSTFLLLIPLRFSPNFLFLHWFLCRLNECSWRHIAIQILYVRSSVR